MVKIPPIFYMVLYIPRWVFARFLPSTSTNQGQIGFINSKHLSFLFWPLAACSFHHCYSSLYHRYQNHSPPPGLHRLLGSHPRTQRLLVSNRRRYCSLVGPQMWPGCSWLKNVPHIEIWPFPPKTNKFLGKSADLFQKNNNFWSLSLQVLGFFVPFEHIFCRKKKNNCDQLIQQLRPGIGDGGNMLQLKLNVLSKCTRPQDLQPARASIDSISRVVVRSAQIGT